MADAITTGETNSEAATQTGASGATAQSSSTTPLPSTEGAPGADAAAKGGADTAPGADGNDGLDGGSILGDAAKTDAKPEGEGEGKEGEAGKEGDATDPNAELIGAPEGDYDLTGVLPEGTVLDADALAKIAPTAKALNLSNAGLARIASEGLPIVQKQVSDGIIADVVAQRAEWDQSTRTAIQGGTGEGGVRIEPEAVYAGKSFDEVTATAARAIDRFTGEAVFPAAKADGTPGTFRDFLKTTGLGNHPAMMRFAYQAGALISEDSSFERGGNLPNTPKSREEKYYPTS